MKKSLFTRFERVNTETNNRTFLPLSEMREDAFVNVKEACMRLQERTRCSNEVVIKMLNEVSQFYITQVKKSSVNPRWIVFKD